MAKAFKPKIRIFKPRITAYAKNVGRSFGYAVGDVAGNYAPVLKDIINDTKNAVDDAKMSMGETKYGIKNLIKEFTQDQNILSNTLDDLKTGNWYNKQREEEALNDMFGGFDFDDDDDWGDFDFDDDSDESSDESRDTRAIISSMDDLGENISNSVAASTARSAEYIVAHQKASTRAMYELTGRGFNQVSGILLNMSDTMVGLASLGEPLTQHINNSSVFYTKTTEQLGEITNSLNKLVERTAYLDSKNKSSNKKNNKFEDIVSGGEFSLSSYIEMVKENTKEQLEMISSFKETLELLFGKGGKNGSLAPLGIQKIVETIMPDFFKASLQQFSESINNALVSGLARGARAARKSNSLILSTLADILFPDMSTKKSINLNKYERGPMQWDGESKKALTDVIPTYLAKIYASLSGDERYFDYKKGIFTSIKEINEDKDKFIKHQARVAGGEFRRQALKKAGGNAKVERAIENMFVGAMMNDEFDFAQLAQLYHKDKKLYFKVMKQLGVSSDYVDTVTDIIVQTMEEARSGKFGNSNRNMLGKFEADVYSAKARISREFSEQEAHGGPWGNLYDEFKTGGYVRVGTGGNGVAAPNERVGGVHVRDYRYKGKNSKRNDKYEKIIAANGEEKYKVKGRYLFNKDEFEEFQKLNKEDQEAYLKSNEGRLIKAYAEETKRSITNSIKNIGKGNNKEEEEPATSRDQITGMDSLKYLYQKPFYAVSVAMDKFSQGINDLFWGPNGNDGIIDRIKNKINDTWKDIKEHFANFFKDQQTGEELSLKDAMKQEWGNIKNKVRTAFFGDEYTNKKGLFDKAKDAKTAFDRQYLEQFTSGELEKFGYSAMGSGLIHKIPSHRLSSAFKRTKRFRSTMFSGGDSGQYQHLHDDVYYNPSNGKYYRKKVRKTGNNIGEEYYKEIKTDTKSRAYNAKNILAISRAHAGNVTDAAKERFDALGESKPVKALTDGASVFAHGLMDFFSQVAYGDKDIEEQKKLVQEKLSKTMEDIAPAKGAMGIGAIAGGVGIPLLTGALIGPIAGAALGAGIGLATKSQSFQDFLFGEGDPEDPKYNEGLLGGFGKALKQNNFKGAKTMGAGAAIGSILGTSILGSPIVGSILGSAAGYVASSEKAQEILFGSGDNKKLLGEVKDEIKKRVPNITAGAIAGLVAGPFGSIGVNLILGAGIGYVSASEKFKEFLLGPEEEALDDEGNTVKRRRGGLAGKIHDRIINPLDDIMHNLGLNIKNRTAKLYKELTKLAKKGLKSALGVGRSAIEGIPLIGEAARWIGRRVKGVAEIPGMVLSGIDNRIQRSNLNIGAGVYDTRLGRNQTAEERYNTRNRMVTGTTETGTDPVTGETIYYKVDPITGRRTKIGRNQYFKLQERKYQAQASGIGYGMGKLSNGYAALDEILMGMDDKELANIDLEDENSIREAITKAAYKGYDKMNPEQQENVRTKLEKVLHDVDFKTSAKGLLKDELKGREAANAKKAEEDDKKIRNGQLKFFGEEGYNKILAQNETSIWGSLGRLVTYVGAIGKDIGGEAFKKLGEKVSETTQEIKDNSIFGENGKPNDTNDTTISDMLSNFNVVGHTEDGNDVLQPKENSGEGSGIRKFLRKFSGGATEEEHVETSTDFLGNVHQYRVNNQGERIEDTGDKETINSRKVINKFTESINTLPIIGSVLSGFKGFGKAFGSGDGDDKDKKKKKGLLEQIADFLNPDSENSGWAKFGNFLARGKAWGANVVGWAGLATIGVTTAAAMGKLDDEARDTVKKFDKDDNVTSEGRYNSGSYTATMSDGSTAQLQTKDGELVTDENGNYRDLEGNTVTPDQVESISKTQNRGLQKSLWKNMAIKTARNVAKGKGLGGVMPALYKTGANMVKAAAKVKGSQFNTMAKIGKNAVKSGKILATKAIDNATGIGYFAKKAGKAAVESSIGKKILEILTKAGELIVKVAKKFKVNISMDKIDDFVKSVATRLSSYLDDAAKKAGKSLTAISDAIPVIGQIIWAGDLLITATNAWGDAENILGIIEEASTGQKIMATLIATINEAIPVIGGFIPHDIMASIVIWAFENTLGRIPLFANATANLRQQQAYAKQVVDAYNMENGTSYTIEEYNLNVNENVKSGWWTSTKHAVSSKWETWKNNRKKNKEDNTSSGGGREFSGGSSGFVSQFDPKYQNFQISGDSFAGKGCGPAVASMTASALGKNLPVSSAVSASQGYQNGNGVTLDYFADALGSQGIDTQYIAGGGAGDLYGSIASGKKVVLLGQDASNTSKENSPFGPNNHYVVATGLDGAGNVVVNDPEMNRPTVYNPGILNSVKYGVAAGRSGIVKKNSRISKIMKRFSGGASGYDTPIAQQVWAFFIQNGFSPIAAASIMGNLYAESGMRPDAIQGKGKGPAAGIAQWESYSKKSGRWLNLYNHAKSMGVEWTDLNAQLTFLLSEVTTKDINSRMQGKTAPSNLTKAGLNSGMTFEDFKSTNKDIDKGTRVFEAAFERAGKPHMDTRITAAKAYYELYSGKQYTYDASSVVSSATTTSAAINAATSDTSSAATTTDETGTTKKKYSFNNIFDVGSLLGTLFSDALAGTLNKNEDEDTGETGDINPNPTEETTEGETFNASENPKGSSIVDVLKSKMGKIKYDMYGPRDPEKGSADCSSTVRWAVKKASGVDIGGSTDSQYSSANLTPIWYGNGAYADNIPENAQPGDILFFSRPNKKYTIGRKDRVGHVEVYEGDGKMIGIGSGVGPVEKTVPLGQKGKLIKVSRVAASGSGLLDYSDIARYAGGSSGILMNSRAGSMSNKASVLDPSTGRLVPISRYAGGATNITEASRNMLNTLQSSTTNNTKNSNISPEVVTQLLSAITTILNNIADNTAPVNKIYQALVAYLESGGSSGTKDMVKVNNNSKKAAAGQSAPSTSIDDSFKSLVTTLAQLAKG